MMKTEGLILAAGFSRRAGVHKMMLDIGGKTILERCIEGMYDACSGIIVVGGYRIENLRPVCGRYKKVKLIFNRDYALGMFSSLKAGLRAVKAPRFFFTPGDYPFIEPSTYRNMLKSGGKITLPVFHGLSGHPVLMESFFIKEILSARQASLRDFLETKEITRLNVEDPGILLDIDTMDDYNRLRRWAESKAADSFIKTEAW